MRSRLRHPVGIGELVRQRTEMVFRLPVSRKPRGLASSIIK